MKFVERQFACHMCDKSFFFFPSQNFYHRYFRHMSRVFGLTRILSPSTPILPPSLSLVSSCCGSDQSIFRPASPQSSSIPLFLEWITELRLPLTRKLYLLRTHIRCNRIHGLGEACLVIYHQKNIVNIFGFYNRLIETQTISLYLEFHNCTASCTLEVARRRQ
jgi:hypothetical protein